MNKRFLYFFPLIILAASCHKYDRPKSFVTLEGPFDTTVVAVNGGETCIGIKEKILIADTVCIRMTIMVRDHDGSHAYILQTDSLFDYRQNLIRTVESECRGLKDSVFLFAGHPVLCVSPCDSSSWIENICTTFSYSDQGVCCLSECRNADGKLLCSRTFNYDSEGKLLSVLEKRNGIDLPQTIKQYDIAGHLVREVSDIGETVFEYNEYGKCITRRFNNVTEHFKYDRNGTLTESKSYYSDQLDFSIEYKYDTVNGHILPICKVQRFYEKGELDPETYAIYQYKYDKWGRITMETELNKSGNNLVHDREFHYSYDDQKNNIVMGTIDNMKDKRSDEIFKYYSLSVLP